MDAEEQLNHVYSKIVEHIEDDLAWIGSTKVIINEVTKRGRRFIVSRDFDLYITALNEKLDKLEKHKKMLLEIWKE